MVLTHERDDFFGVDCHGDTALSRGIQWGETFTVDAWGNMTNETPISGKTGHEGLSTSALGNKQSANSHSARNLRQLTYAVLRFFGFAFGFRLFISFRGQLRRYGLLEFLTIYAVADGSGYSGGGDFFRFGRGELRVIAESNSISAFRRVHQMPGCHHFCHFRQRELGLIAAA